MAFLDSQRTDWPISGLWELERLERPWFGDFGGQLYFLIKDIGRLWHWYAGWSAGRGSNCWYPWFSRGRLVALAEQIDQTSPLGLLLHTHLYFDIPLLGPTVITRPMVLIGDLLHSGITEPARWLLQVEWYRDTTLPYMSNM
jgi:hypothetical protein